MKKIKITLAIVTALFAGYLISFSFPNEEPETVETRRVIDGDTFVADIGGVIETVRLIGIDAPELGTLLS